MLLQVQNLSKMFSGKEILSDITFSVNEGEVIGLIGPNGSGKTTLLNILLGMLQPTSGSYSINDKWKIGMSVSRKGFFDDMTVSKNIQHHAALLRADESQIQEGIHALSIDYLHIKYGKLSAGMKQRISLLLAFVRNSNLIFLDEPTNHLDIDSIISLRHLILKSKTAKTSFLITSHVFSDLEKICDRIMFLKNGVLVENSKTNDLLRIYGDLEKAYINILQTKNA